MNPVDVVIKSQALNSDGFTADNTVEGLGLNTFGFLWPCEGIWAPFDPNITTAWTTCGSSSASIDVCVD